MAEAVSSGTAATAASALKTEASSALTTRGGASAALSRSARRARTQLPEPVRLALVVVLSFAIAALGDSFVHFATNGELGAIARRPESKAEMAVLASWKMYVIPQPFLSWPRPRFPTGVLPSHSRPTAAHPLSPSFPASVGLKWCAQARPNEHRLTPRASQIRPCARLVWQL